MESNSRFWLITHDNEHDKPSNTGKLIKAIWPETQVINWSRVVTDENLLNLINDDSKQKVLVFPSQYAVEHQSSWKKVLENNECINPVTFIILDATWQQARKMYRQSPYLHDLLLLSLNPESASIYTLRRNRHDQHLCTAEVAALVLKEFGEKHQALLLESLVQVYCDQYLWTRKGQQQVKNSKAHHFLLNHR